MNPHDSCVIAPGRGRVYDRGRPLRPLWAEQRIEHGGKLGSIQVELELQVRSTLTDRDPPSDLDERRIERQCAERRTQLAEQARDARCAFAVRALEHDEQL